MKKIIFALLFMPVLSLASGGVHLDHVNVNVGDTATLQRGAKLYVGYCMGCHSIKYVSYGRLRKDLKLTEDQVFKHLMGSHEGKKKLSDYMITSMTDSQAKQMFAAVPPDLSTISRSRGEDWLYTYLRSFYNDPKDKTRPFGVNNLLIKGLSMPHVMLKLQGAQTAVFEEYVENTIKKKRFIKFVPVNAEGLSKKQLAAKAASFDSNVKDLVTFLSYVGDPGKLNRQAVGFWVLVFMVIFTILAYLMKKEFWKDIH